ncbi:hypothetical protein [Amycolatopsis sp. WAC 01376]|uniref:DUF7002 family protein n=1 Tax=Amycolatopsis sp. WAC 01376 TaxID=2203195 RepID=UPI000F792E1B|nr:hypothetical protein [Amycolatopsis sp. WAC 01376]
MSTKALVDLYEPDADTAEAILTRVRKKSVTIESSQYGRSVIRDQLPLKFLDQCLLPGTSPLQFLDALNGRVFFWLNIERLQKLLNARQYRHKQQTVLHVDTAELIARYGDQVQLAPYNTGSMHVPNSPPRGVGVFVDLADYPYDEWVEKRRRTRVDPVVELTVPYSVPDIRDFTIRVERWKNGSPVETLCQKNA